ncbi:hypothetical protein AURDEDRAFT_161988 [Auricularia subglabra TFB-10046 SS5]|nr:hypothetical protein AURDEDRAFT_161988 [Auricularia subglabra TFB-10046 SS5]
MLSASVGVLITFLYIYPVLLADPQHARLRLTTEITNVRVFDGREVFSGPETIYIGADGQISHSRPSRLDAIVDGTNKFLVPGLIESHAHPASTEELTEFASYGVTTVFSLATFNFTDALALKRDAREAGLPDVLLAGVPAVGVNGRHAMMFKQAPHAVDWLLAPQSDLANFVDWNFGNGSDFIKVVAQENGPTLAQQSEIVRRAHAHDRMVATHAVDLESYRVAVQSKADSVHHSVSDAPLSADIVQLMRAQGQVAVPTLVLTKLVKSHAPLRAIFRGMAHPGATLAQALANARALHAAGVPLLAGTDAVSLLGITLPHGITLQCELELLVEAGMSPAEALRAATADAAGFQRLSDRGVVRDGLRADLLLLGANPTEDITNIAAIEKAWIDGFALGHSVGRSGGCANIVVGFKPWIRALGIFVRVSEVVGDLASKIR